MIRRLDEDEAEGTRGHGNARLSIWWRRGDECRSRDVWRCWRLEPMLIRTSIDSYSGSFGGVCHWQMDEEWCCIGEAKDWDEVPNGALNETIERGFSVWIKPAFDQIQMKRWWWTSKQLLVSADLGSIGDGDKARTTLEGSGVTREGAKSSADVRPLKASSQYQWGW